MVGTAVFAALILLLFFLVQITSIQDKYNEPVLINFGDSEDGVGAAVATPAPPTAAVPPPPSTVKKQETTEENLANQIDESPVTTVEKKKNTIVKPTPKELEENRKKIQQELLKQQQAAIADKARKMGSVFGSDHGNGSGDGQKGDGTKGNPLGKVGGTGSIMASVSGRSVTYTPSPAYNSNDEGKVTVSVTVDKDGNVIGASISSATTSSGVLREAAMQAARRSKFSSGSNEAIGTITYRFILK